jgi:hypothetical protein
MKNFFLTKILMFIGRKLSGYKLYIGIALKCMAGLMGMIQTMYPDLAVAIPHNASDSIDSIGSAFVGLGAAHKAQKLLVATQAIIAGKPDTAQDQIMKDTPKFIDKMAGFGPGKESPNE